MTSGSVDIRGSWFPSGFWGHNRSSWRNDFVNKYRQQAKPAPPSVFLRRLQLVKSASSNPFSEHDTRQSRDYLNLIFYAPDRHPAGAAASSGSAKPGPHRSGSFNFTHWPRVPGEPNYYSSPTSSYTQSYTFLPHPPSHPRQESNSQSNPTAGSSVQHKLYATRPWSSYLDNNADNERTTYRQEFCSSYGPSTGSGAGTGSRLDAMGNAELLHVRSLQLHDRSSGVEPTGAGSLSVPHPPAHGQAQASGSRPRAQTAKVRIRDEESVASCMVWHDPSPPQMPRQRASSLARPFSAYPSLLPAATPTSTFDNFPANAVQSTSVAVPEPSAPAHGPQE